MGSGLSIRRGVLRKPAECKPPPPPPIPPSLCTCSVDLAGLPAPYFLRALCHACHLLAPNDQIVVVAVTSTPGLTWVKVTDTKNCGVGGLWYSSLATPGVFYRVHVTFDWPAGFSCSADGAIVYSP